MDKLALEPSTLQAAKNGSVKARNALIVANLPNIRQAIPRIRKIPIDSFLGVAVIAFMGALQSLDPNSINPESYVSRSIQWAVFHQLRDEQPGDTRGRHRELSLVDKDGEELPYWLIKVVAWICPKPQESGEEIEGRISDLRRRIPNLPPIQQKIIVLRHYCDQSQSEAASNMKLSIAKAQEYYADGLNMLREQIGVPHKPVIDRTPKSKKQCLCCGGAIAHWNDTGYCTRTQPCRMAWERARYQPKGTMT
jgi:RNA polymerase sigma factor (sigma-70 family)